MATESQDIDREELEIIESSIHSEDEVRQNILSLNIQTNKANPSVCNASYSCSMRLGLLSIFTLRLRH
jgi:hypothetical protein